MTGPDPRHQDAGPVHPVRGVAVRRPGTSRAFAAALAGILDANDRPSSAAEVPSAGLEEIR